MAIYSRVSERLRAYITEQWVTHDTALKESICNDGSSILPHVTEFHGSFIVIRGVVDTAHQPLIIPEKEDGQGRHAVDAEEETPLLQLVHDIGLGDDIHV